MKLKDLFIFDNVSRRENITLKLTVDITKKNKVSLKKQASALNIYSKWVMGDQLNISYNFNIDYLDGIDKRLAAILAIVEREDVKITSASVAVIYHEKVLINEILRKLQELESVMGGKL